MKTIQQVDEVVKLRADELFWRSRHLNNIQPSEPQTKAVESLLRTRIAKEAYYKDCLDFGCGSGRFIPFLSSFCGHVWAADIVPELLADAEKQALTVSPIHIKWPIKLPCSNRIDFLWAGFVFQHITDDRILLSVLKELSSCLQLGAKVFILDNAVDRASHVKPRVPDLFASHLRLGISWRSNRVNVNKTADDHWLLEGTVE